MKKLVKFGTMLMSVSLMGGMLSLTNSVAKVDAYDISGDLYGSARIKCTTPRSSDVGNVTEIDVGGTGNADYSGSGIYLRMKNYTSTDTPLTFKLNSTNGTIIAPTTSVKQTYYDTNGNEVTGINPRGWGNYLMLPANFDGFVYMNYTSQMSRIVGGADFDASHIWRIYIEYSGSYDSYADYAIGDIFTDEKLVLDTSELDDAAFATTFINQCPNYQSITQNARAEDTTFIPKGDLLGGVHASQSGYGGFMVKFGEPKDLSDGGVCFRLKNNLPTTSWVMAHIASDWFGNRAINLANAKFYRYNANGTGETEYTINEWGYFEVPGNFDGFIYIPNSSFVGDTTWAGADYHSNTAIALYLEADTYDLSVGDISSKSVVAFDGSEHYANELGSIAETWSGASLSSLPGSKEVEVPLYDYTQVEYQGSITGGIQLRAKACPDSSVFSPATITFADELDLSNGEAVAVNFKGVGTYAFQLEFADVDGNTMQMPIGADAPTKPIYLIKDGSATAINHTSGDPNTIHATDTEGVIVIEKDFLTQKSGDTFNWARIKQVIVRVHTFYDDGFNVVLGDIGTVSQSEKTHALSFVANDVDDIVSMVTTDEYLTASRYFVAVPSSWIGDVKIIDSLNYKDDAELKRNVTYDIGDNACSYRKENDGMFVHIGPYEVGHTYGSYMCLGMFDKGVTTDRAQAWRMNGDEKEYAKGVTFYAENRSNKEIGMTLQFDEEIPGKAECERWCIVGYPAMYYAWDVVTNAEYLLYAKSDQIQLPVGFKGYIRVPFASYSVPNWNSGTAGVDEILDLDHFTSNFFLTSDNTRFEDLEFFIKNVGIYFNETRKGNVFSNENTIKANMGLDD